MKKYVFLFGVNALIMLALSVNAVMTIMASCSASGQCTAAVTPLTWGLAVLPLVVLVASAIFFAPRAFRSLRAEQSARKEAKAERAAVAVVADDADGAAQARLHRLSRPQAYDASDADREPEAPAESASDVFDDAAEAWPDASVDADPASEFDVEPTAEPATSTDFDAVGTRPMLWPIQTPPEDHIAASEAVGDTADAIDTPYDSDTPYDTDLGTNAPIAEPGQEDWDAVFPRLGASTLAEPDAPVEGPWDWLMTEAHVDQLRPCAQTGFPWVAATVAEMASAILEQARADRLGTLLPEVEAWLSIAGEMAPDEPIAGADADGFIGWVNDLAVHCHMVGEPVGVSTLLAQAMDRLTDRAGDDRLLAQALPPQLFSSPPDWNVFAKAS